jgi:four helix bundle protein
MAPGGFMGHSYRELIVWQKARALAVQIYRQTEKFPKSEIYGITSQLRRAAVSVTSNIAEGQGRLTTGEFQQFLGHSRGSLLELDSQLAIASDLGYLPPGQYEALEHQTYQVLGLINRLLDSLRNSKRVVSSKP